MQKRNKLKKFLVMFSILSILSIVSLIFINKNNIINLAKNEKEDIKAITSTDGKWEYVVIDETNKTVRVKGYIIDDAEKENETKLNIPSTIDEYIVISLDTNMLWGTGYTYTENYENMEDNYITDITIPSTIIDVKDGNSYNQSKLQNIDVDSNNPNYASVDGVLYNKEKTKLIRCPTKKTNIDIPSSVISIDEMAFQWCANLTSETIEKVNAINAKTNSHQTEDTNLGAEILEPADKDLATDNMIENEVTLSEDSVSKVGTLPETVVETQNILPGNTADTYKISLMTDNNTIKQGERVTISLNISDINIQTGEKGIGAYKGDIEYDSNVFEEVKMSGNSNWDEPGENKGIFASVNSKGICVRDSQEIAKITLKAKSNAVLGNTKIKIKGFEVSSLAENMISTEDTSIDVIINSSSNSGTGSGSTGTGSGTTGTGSGSTGTGSGTTGTGSGTTGTGSGSTGTGSGTTGTGSGITGTGSGTTGTGSGTTGTGSGTTGTGSGTTGRGTGRTNQDENKLTNSTISDKKIPFAGKTVDLVVIIGVGIVVIITIYAYIKYERI